MLNVLPAVAYVTYDKASSAALAIEGLNGAVLNDGRGPKLKVLLADAPQSRWAMAGVGPSSEALKVHLLAHGSPAALRADDHFFP